MMVYLLLVLLGIALADPDCTKIKSTVVRRGQNITISSTHHNADKSVYDVLVSLDKIPNVSHEIIIPRATCRDDFTCTPGSNSVSGKSEICCDFNHVTLNKMNASIHDTGIYKIYRFGVSIRKNETCVYSNATVTGKVNEPTSTSPSPGSKEPHSGPVKAVWGPIIGWMFFGLIIFGLIIYFCYKKVERFKIAICNFWSHLKCVNCFSKKQDMAGNMEMGEMRVNEETGALVDSEATGEIGQKEEMRANGATGALGVSEATRETGQKEEMRANGATGALGVSEATGEIGEREEMGESGEVGDMRAREETEETEKLLPHMQNNTVYQTKHSLTNPLHCE